MPKELHKEAVVENYERDAEKIMTPEEKKISVDRAELEEAKAKVREERGGAQALEDFRSSVGEPPVSMGGIDDPTGFVRDTMRSMASQNAYNDFEAQSEIDHKIFEENQKKRAHQEALDDDKKMGSILEEDKKRDEADEVEKRR